jgi:predicted nucleotide-binding protein (sugar kinase/HSP70/actin superfamily)
MVGEIFCRLSTFSNDDVIREIEAHGGEVWISDVVEWVYYINFWEREELRTFDTPYSLRMFKAWLTDRVQKSDDHKLVKIFEEELKGREEPKDIGDIVDLGSKYLDPHAALGEMILNVGKSVYLADKGVDAVIDVSPFSCMNAIVSEAIYPTLSKDLKGLPIRSFYFDGTGTNLDEEVEIFMELAGHYRSSRGR